MSITITWPTITMNAMINRLEDRMQAVKYGSDAYEELRELRDEIAEENHAEMARQAQEQADAEDEALRREESSKAYEKAMMTAGKISEWKDLRPVDQDILEHLADPTQVDVAPPPSLLEVQPGKVVRVDGRERVDLPKPTKAGCKRMLAFLEGQRGDMEIFERIDDGFRAKPKPGVI